MYVIDDDVVGVLVVECGWHVTGAVWIALTFSVNSLLISCCLLGLYSLSALCNPR